MLVAAAAAAVEGAGRRDHGREGRARAPVRQARHLRRARRAAAKLATSSSRDAAATTSAQGPADLHADRQAEPAPPRHGGEDHRAAVYTHDVQLPGMLTAVVAHPPRFGAEAKGFDADRGARRSRAWSTWSRSPRGRRGGGQDHLGGDKGRDALKVDWDESGAERRGTEDAAGRLPRQARGGDAAVARNGGNVEQALKAGGEDARGGVRVPLPRPRADGADELRSRGSTTSVIEVWGGHAVAGPSTRRPRPRSLGVTPDKVKLHIMIAGGSFGRRANADSDCDRRGGRRRQGDRLARRR